MTPKKHTTDWLPFRALTVDLSYQRDPLISHVKRLHEGYDERKLGVLTVSIRDGKAYVVDGNHRRLAALEGGRGDQKALCEVFRGLTRDEEAALFLARNDAKKIKPTDRYKAGLVAGDPICVGVRDTLAEHGLVVRPGGSDGCVQCVSEVLKLYERDPALLDEVCAVLVESWGTRAAALERIPVASMGVVLGRFNGEVDRGALAKKLAKYRGGPAALAGDARGLHDYKPISVVRAAAEIIVDTYNRGRRSGQLSPL